MLTTPDPDILQFAAAADTSVDVAKRTMVATLSTLTLSHTGDLIVPSGMSFKTYRTNPVVPWSHMYFMPPVGKNMWIKRDGDSIVGKTLFAQRPDNHQGEWLPDTLLSLYDQDVLHGVSVGVKVMESVWKDDMTDEDKKKYPQMSKSKNPCSRVLKKTELLEYSCCTIPMNPDALTHALTEMNVSSSLSKIISLAADSGPTASGAAKNEVPTPNSGNSDDTGNTPPPPEPEPQPTPQAVKIDAITAKDVEVALLSMGTPKVFAQNLINRIDVERMVRLTIDRVRGKV